MASRPVTLGDETRSRGKTGSALAIVALAVGLAGLVASLGGVVIELLPREFTAGQQRAIMSWQTAGRWRTDAAGAIFPARVGYPPPAVLRYGTLPDLTAKRVGIAQQARCAAAVDRGAAAVLHRYGCDALLRASYADATDSYVLTVGVAVLPGTAQARAARHALSRRPAGVRAARFTGTVSAGFGNARRQLLGSFSEGPYLVLYAIGYTDDRPRVPVADDHYADAEMTALGAGVARRVGDNLGAPPAMPRCPGAPGC